MWPNILAAALPAAWPAQTGRQLPGVQGVFGVLPIGWNWWGEVDGVSYYNDSIATTPNRTQAASIPFPSPLFYWQGGSDKQLSYTELGRVIHQRAKQAVLFGATGPAIRQAILDSGPCPIEMMVSNLEEAVMLASKVAETGDVVLLSPASASFDQ